MELQQHQVEQVFHQAAEIESAAERLRFLDQACGPNQQLRDRVQQLLAAESKVHSFLESPAPGAELGPTMASSGTQDSSAGNTLTEKPGTRIGPYKLLQMLGEGGMGVVYMAEQTEPVERRVALKIIKPGMDTRQVIARFEAERQALAMMDHPNIAHVVDAGTTDSGRPFFAMELVKGVPITEYCDAHQLTVRERLDLFVAVCHAVQHAHQKGIIHRDIKPSNVLVAEYDDHAVPKIIDFGVAKATQTRLTEKTMFTQMGQVVGTLEYMSPEQAKLNQLDIDTRSDIYSLGVLLYKLLTGETPFDRQRLKSAAFDEMLRILREEEPPRPSLKLSTSVSLPSIAANRHVEPKKLSGLIRGELDWIVMKSMEKDRNRRYETANAFADDIAHYLNDEAVAACPPSAAYRFRKLARRNKASLAVAATGLLVLALFALVSTLAAGRFRLLAHRNADLVVKRTEALAAETEAKQAATEALRQATDAKNQADRARLDAEYNLYLADIGSAHANWKVGHVAQTKELLSKYISSGGTSDLRGWEWYYLQSLTAQEKLAFREHSDVVGAVAWSHDGLRIASGDWSGAIRIWDPVTGTELHRLQSASAIVVDLEWSHDDQRLAAISATEAVEVWDATSWNLEFSRAGTQRGARTVPITTELAWNPAKTQLAFTAERTVLFWTANSGEDLRQLETNRPATSLAWDRTGELLATGFNGSPVDIWRVETAEREHQIETGLINIIGAIGFSADNELLATGNDKGYVKVWKWKTGEEVHLFEHNGPADTIDWQPVGSHLAVGSRGQQIRIWNVADGKLATTFQGHTHWITSIAWSPDGELLVSAGGADRDLRIWEFATRGNATREFIKFNPSKNQSLQREQNGELVICDTSTGEDICVLPADADTGNRSLWSPDERLLGVRLPDAVRIRDAETGRLIVELPRARYVVWSPDSRMVACLVKETQELFISEAQSGDELLRISCPGILHEGYRWSNDSALLAAQRDYHSRISLTHVADNREVLSIQASNIRDLTFSPDDRYIAFSEPDALRIWNVVEGIEVHVLPHNLGGHQGIFWGPDSSLIAIGGVSGPVDVWDLEKEAKKFTLRGHSAMVAGVAFSPDGSRIATGAQDHTVRIWDATNGHQVLLLNWDQTHNPIVRQWSSDGKRLVIQRLGGDWSTVFLDASQGYTLK